MTLLHTARVMSIQLDVDYTFGRGDGKTSFLLKLEHLHCTLVYTAARKEHASAGERLHKTLFTYTLIIALQR